MQISNQQIMKILDALQDCIFEELNSTNCRENIVDLADHTVFSGVEWAAGVTKVVLFPRGMEIVVKIPFMGEGFSDGSFTFFEGAFEPDGWDYCKVESILFETAETEGEYLSDYFLETEYIGSVHGHPIYIQERGVTLDDTKPNNWDEDQPKEQLIRNDEIRRFCNKRMLKCFNPTWIADFIDYYSEASFLVLERFLRNNDISDLHSENIGYSLAGVPVIIDYSSFHS